MLFFQSSLMRELLRVIIPFQASIVPITRIYGVDKNHRRSHVITAVFRKNDDNKLRVSIEDGILTELISDIVK